MLRIALFLIALLLVSDHTLAFDSNENVTESLVSEEMFNNEIYLLELAYYNYIQIKVLHDISADNVDVQLVTLDELGQAKDYMRYVENSFKSRNENYDTATSWNKISPQYQTDKVSYEAAIYDSPEKAVNLLRVKELALQGLEGVAKQFNILSQEIEQIKKDF